MDPLVSIIIATYNARKWLGEAVDSALMQTHSLCEVLVVDDGSTDGTGKWLAAQYGGRIRYLHKENGGLASARNWGLRFARGKYIQFLDADDLILPSKVATHVNYLERHPDVDVVYCHCLCFHDGSKSLYDWSRWPRYQSGQIFNSMIDEGYLHTHMLLSRRSLLDTVGGFDESLRSCVEWDFWLRVAWSKANFCYLEGEPMALYRIRPESNSHQHVNHGRVALALLKKTHRYVGDCVVQRSMLRQAEGRWRFALGRALVESGRLREGLWEMMRSFFEDRRDLDYKVSFMMLSVLAGPKKAADAQQKLSSIKNKFLDHVGDASRCRS